MAVLTYKCPNCDGELLFDPASQEYKCEYCLDHFSQAELERNNPAQAEDRNDTEPEGGEGEQAAGGEIHADVYTCPSCGAEVITDETTAATFCYYCHNPVTLSGRLDGPYAPDCIIPFDVDREKATEVFFDWTKKKRFIPRAFFAKEQVEKICGVYFPYWMVSCDVHGAMDARATRVRSWRAGNTQYTETKFFRVMREGDIHYPDITMNALKKADPRLAEGVQPFDPAGVRGFSMPYLSGFQAEKRNLEKANLEPELDKNINDYTTSLLKESAPGYTTVVPEHLTAVRTKSDWKYALLPVWLLTYRGNDKKDCFYAMNGQTGKVAGVLPVDYGRLAVLFGLIAAPLFILLMLGGYFL